MLHIILGILKLTGIIIGILFLLLLAVILAVLFVPVTYRVRAELQEEKQQAGLRIGWLFRAVSASVSVKRDSGLSIVIRLLGIPLPLFHGRQKLRPGGAGGSRRRRREKREAEPSGDGVRTAEDEEWEDEGTELTDTLLQENGDRKNEKIRLQEDENAGSGEIHRQEEDENAGSGEIHRQEEDENAGSGESHRKEEDEEAGSGEANQEEENPGAEDDFRQKHSTAEEEVRDEGETESSDGAGEMSAAGSIGRKLEKIRCKIIAICGKIKKIYGRAVRFFQTLLSLPGKISEALGRLSRLLHKPEELLELARRYEAAEVLRCQAGRLGYLLRHYRPRRIRGWLRLGTGDPAVTGQVTGLVYLLLPAKADRFHVMPEFEQRILEADINCRGRIRGCHLLRVGVQLLFDRKLRRLIRNVRNNLQTSGK